MIRNARQLLSQPYPKEKSRAQKWRETLLFGLFVFLFLLIFQPFGLSMIKSKILILSGYGLITSFVVGHLNFVAPTLFPAFYEEKNWFVWKEILSILSSIILIAGFNLVYSYFLGFFEISFTNFFVFLGITISLGVFPVTISVLIKYYSALRQNQQDAQPLHDQLAKPNQLRAHHEGNLELRSSDDELVGIWPIDNIIRIEAAQNYVELYHLKSQELQRSLIRLPIKEVEAQAKKFPNLIRTHRSHMINLQHISEVSGNAQGLQVLLDYQKQAVPVSRSRIKTFQQEFENHS